MPQLMPLNWLFSFLMILFIMVMMIIMYSYIMNKKMNMLFNYKMINKNNWKW